jgi:hypothetical protein
MAKLEHILIPVGEQASVDELADELMKALGLEDLPEGEEEKKLAQLNDELLKLAEPLREKYYAKVESGEMTHKEAQVALLDEAWALLLSKTHD